MVTFLGRHVSSSRPNGRPGAQKAGARTEAGATYPRSIRPRVWVEAKARQTPCARRALARTSRLRHRSNSRSSGGSRSKKVLRRNRYLHQCIPRQHMREAARGHRTRMPPCPPSATARAGRSPHGERERLPSATTVTWSNQPDNRRIGPCRGLQFRLATRLSFNAIRRASPLPPSGRVSARCARPTFRPLR